MPSYRVPSTKILFLLHAISLDNGEQLLAFGPQGWYSCCIFTFECSYWWLTGRFCTAGCWNNLAGCWPLQGLACYQAALHWLYVWITLKVPHKNASYFFIHPSISYICLIQLRVAGGLEPTCSFVRGQVHPGLVASPPQGQHSDVMYNTERQCFRCCLLKVLTDSPLFSQRVSDRDAHESGSVTPTEWCVNLTQTNLTPPRR